MEIKEVIYQKLQLEVDLLMEDSLSLYIRPYVEKEKIVIYEEG